MYDNKLEDSLIWMKKMGKEMLKEKAIFPHNLILHFIPFFGYC